MVGQRSLNRHPSTQVLRRPAFLSVSLFAKIEGWCGKSTRTGQLVLVEELTCSVTQPSTSTSIGSVHSRGGGFLESSRCCLSQIHLTFFTIAPFILSGIFYAANGSIKHDWVDALFMVTSCLCVVGTKTRLGKGTRKLTVPFQDSTRLY